MTASAGPSARNFGLTVTPENILGVRAVVLQEATDLKETLDYETQYAMRPALGGDPVSGDMSVAFNPITHELMGQAREHIKSLFALCEELAATARSYGHTEADITASLGRPTSARSPPSPPLRQLAGLSASASRPAPTTTGQLFGGRE